MNEANMPPEQMHPENVPQPSVTDLQPPKSHMPTWSWVVIVAMAISIVVLVLIMLLPKQETTSTTTDNITSNNVSGGNTASVTSPSEKVNTVTTLLDSGYTLVLPSDMDFVTEIPLSGINGHVLMAEIIDLNSTESRPLGYDPDTLKKAKLAIDKGQVPVEPIDQSNGTANVVKINNGTQSALTYTVLARIEVCDITLERHLVFFDGQGQAVHLVAYFGHSDEIVTTIPEGFMTDQQCGAGLNRWKDDITFDTLLTNVSVSSWNQAFDQMVLSVTK